MANALLTINGASLYNAVYGQTPAMLPEMDIAIEEDGPGTAIHVRRMRAIRIQAIVKGTARARLQRALHTMTVPSRKNRDYKIGDPVDFHRMASSRDARGWKGPAKVIDNTHITRGTITVRYQRDFPIECRVQDIYIPSSRILDIPADAEDTTRT